MQHTLYLNSADGRKVMYYNSKLLQEGLQTPNGHKILAKLFKELTTRACSDDLGYGHLESLNLKVPG